MDSSVSLLLKIAFVVGTLCLIWTLQSRAQARRRRLTTIAARFGLFVSWIATGVALGLGGLGAVGFYHAPTPINQSTWFISGGLCVAAFVVWLLGRGIYFVLAGSPPEEALQPTTRPVPTRSPQAGPWGKPPPRP